MSIRMFGTSFWKEAMLAHPEGWVRCVNCWALFDSMAHWARHYDYCMLHVRKEMGRARQLAVNR